MVIAALLFFGAAAAIKLKQAKRKPSTEKDTDKTSSSASSNALGLSPRGIVAQTPGRSDLNELFHSFSSPYDPIKNPEGFLILLVAENKLMINELKAKFYEISKKEALPDWSTGYGNMSGHDDLRKGIASMMQDSAWKGVPIDPSCISCQAGCGSIIDSLAWCLCEAGDSCIIPGPIYPAFYNDFMARARVTLHVATLSYTENYTPTRLHLDQAFADCTAKGMPPKALIICQPCNPTGMMYSYETMEIMIDWALEKGLHVISDEIYANSCFPEHTMVSACHVMYDKYCDENSNNTPVPTEQSSLYLGNKVHVLQGFSKDFGLSGFRVGCVVTHNKELYTAVDSLSYFQCVSGVTQSLLSSLLSDENKPWMQWYIAENRVRLKRCYEALVDALSVCEKVQLYPCHSTLMAWADFSAYLPVNASWADENALWKELFNDYKILFTTGESCAASRPGFFRICFTYPTVFASDANATSGIDFDSVSQPDVGIAMRELKSRLQRWVSDRRQ